MAITAAPGMTRIGFRRGVKLFLLVLVGFLATLILVLTLLLQSSLGFAREQLLRRQNDLATVAAAALAGGPESESALDAIRVRYGFDAIEMELPNGRVVTSGFVNGMDRVERRAGGAAVRFYFDPGPYQSIRRRIVLTSIVTSGATAIGVALLLLYLPHILRPVEQMLDDARRLERETGGGDEAAYLIETFRSSIATLKSQEEELRRLHDAEKHRADDLATISAALTRSLTSGFLAVDAAGTIAEINAAGREILGVTPDVPVQLADPVDALGDTPFVTALLEAVRTREGMRRGEVELERPTGAQVIGLTTVPLFSGDGRYLGTLALFTDLSQVRRLEVRVRELQALADLGVMSAGLAHEFRNSLSTILGMLQLARRAQPSDAVLSRIAAAEAEGNQLARTITTLLQFARPMQLQLTPVDLRPLLAEMLERFREREPEIRFTLDGPELRIDADSSLLTRAFENLLRNAVDAIRAAGREGSVAVTLADGGAVRTIEIADDGIGIADADVPNLFLPFYSNKSGGVGIGLSLARKIVLLHGGRLTLSRRSDAPGAVATVEFFLSPTP